MHCSCTESEKLQYPKHEKNSGLSHSCSRLFRSRYLGKFFPGFVHRRMVSDADQAGTHAAQHRISDRLERPVPLHGTFARAPHRASAAQRNHPSVDLAAHRQLPVEYPVLHATQSAGRIHRHRTAEYPRGTLHLRCEPQGPCCRLALRTLPALDALRRLPQRIYPAARHPGGGSDDNSNRIFNNIKT